MIHYPHFAFKNIYLINGYTQEFTEHGFVYSYEDEDGLEQAIRCMLLKKVGVLTGWDLRFLRQGLQISQAQFGSFLDRDGQTVARWEKSNNIIPKFADLTIRSYFSKQFEPSITASELISHINGNDTLNQGKQFLSFDNNKWSIKSRLSISPKLYSNSSFSVVDVDGTSEKYFYLRGPLIDRVSRLANIETESNLSETQLSLYNMTAYHSVINSLTNQRSPNEHSTVQ